MVLETNVKQRCHAMVAVCLSFTKQQVAVMVHSPLGISLGTCDGTELGKPDGFSEGLKDGMSLGHDDGSELGTLEGVSMS